MRSYAQLALPLFLFAVACGDDGSETDAGVSSDVGDGAIDDDASVRCDELDVDAVPAATACEALASDYTPDADDDWEACISDDGEYHPIESSISTIARVEAFEAIADLLWEDGAEPNEADFLAARMLYQEEEGLDSRVVRRYDPHIDDSADAPDCALPEAVEMHPDYCVGPARLQPLLLAAFNAGIMGEDPNTQAARIEAALLYFFYVSIYKESLTCTDVAKDCDSAYAYYTGGEPARGGIGLARYVASASPAAHEAAWDGLLAVRCWRDLDQAVPAEVLTKREQARSQYDRAVLRGLAAVLRARLIALGEAACDDAHRSDYVFVTTLASLFDGSVRVRSEDAADALQAALDAREGDLDIEAAIEALDVTLACP